MKVNDRANVSGVPTGGFLTAQGGAVGLGGITTDMEGVPGGVALSTSTNKLDLSNIDGDALDSIPMLDGPSYGVIGVTSVFKITNFNYTRLYPVSTGNGTISIAKDVLKFKPNIIGSCKFKVGNRTLSYNVQGISISTPTILKPSPSVDVGPDVLFTCSAFSVKNSLDTHIESDWQLSLVENFSSIVKSSIASKTNLLSWTAADLLMNKTYYARVRHKGEDIGYSDWSPVFEIQTATNATVDKPIITAPVANQQNIPENTIFKSNGFSVTNWEDTHAASEWQLSTSSTFATILATSKESVGDKLLWSQKLPSANTIFYVRVRYKGTLLGWSAWSNTCAFRTLNTAVIGKPSITTPVANQQNVSLINTFKSNAFTVSNWTDTHVSSEWQLSKVSNFSTILATSGDSTTYKTTWPKTLVDNNTNHYLRVRHKGAKLGWGAWSNTCTFKTLPVEEVAIWVGQPTLYLDRVTLPAGSVDYIKLSYRAPGFDSNGDFIATETQVSYNEAFTTSTAKFKNYSQKQPVNIRLTKFGTNSTKIQIMDSSTSAAGSTITVKDLETVCIRVRNFSTGGGISDWSDVVYYVLPIPVATEPYYITSGYSNEVLQPNGTYKTTQVMHYYSPTGGQLEVSYNYVFDDRPSSGTRTGSGSGTSTSPARVSDTPYAAYFIAFTVTVPGRNITLTMDNGQVFNI